jgi:hypothetical protein
MNLGLRGYKWLGGQKYHFEKIEGKKRGMK